MSDLILPVALIAALVVIVFLAVWWFDKQRADEVEQDPERLHTDTDSRDHGE